MCVCVHACREVRDWLAKCSRTDVGRDHQTTVVGRRRPSRDCVRSPTAELANPASARASLIHLGVERGPIWGPSVAELGLIWGRSRFDLGAIRGSCECRIWARSEVDLRSTRDRSATASGWSWDGSGAYLQSIWGRCAAIDLLPIWGRCLISWSWHPPRRTRRASATSGVIESAAASPPPAGTPRPWMHRPPCRSDD